MIKALTAHFLRSQRKDDKRLFVAKRPFQGQQPYPGVTPNDPTQPLRFGGQGFERVSDVSISFDDLYKLSATRVTPPLGELRDIYSRKLDLIVKQLDEVRDRMNYLRAASKTDSSDWNFRLGLMGTTRSDETRAPTLRWRPRTNSRIKPHWIAWDDWPAALAECNCPPKWMTWYEELSSVALVLNTQAATLHSARRVLLNDQTAMRLMLGERVEKTVRTRHPSNSINGAQQ